LAEFSFEVFSTELCADLPGLERTCNTFEDAFPDQSDADDATSTFTDGAQTVVSFAIIGTVVMMGLVIYDIFDNGTGKLLSCSSGRFSGCLMLPCNALNMCSLLLPSL